ncbi:teichoic acid translocation permease protein TagG [mine drainage metagenome]|uniref:Teichoic acid translocation permease protein TagG n=1 Tax=mine drainage metagenome TaxID=410659 RepID=A0A1J5SRT3_9ZZZZ
MDPHQQHPTSLAALFASFWRNRRLILQMSQREVVGRYRGSVMGLAWSFFNPLLLLVVYTFVFSVVFKSRWGEGADESKANIAIVLFAGMIVNGLFAECINRAPGLILSNVNYVKKVVFPLEILPWTAMGATLFHAAISVIVLLVAQLILSHSLPWTSLFLPLIFLPLVLVTMGFSWFLAATGVFMRDIAQTTGIFTTVLTFLAPVFYPITALPKKYQPWLHLNPLTFIIEQARLVLIWGKLPDWLGLAIYFAVSLLIASMGFWWFQKTRKGFADVL